MAGVQTEGVGQKALEEEFLPERVQDGSEDLWDK